MSEKNDESLELRKEATKDFNELLKEMTQGAAHIPVLSTIYAFIGFSVAKWEKAKLEEFLDQIRLHLAFDNVGHVAAHIAENYHHQWMADGLVRGWKLGLETMDDTARKCAYNMVAEYMALRKPHDRVFRQLAELFKASDVGILRMLLRLAEALSGFKETCLIGTSESTEEGHFGYAIFELGTRFFVLDPIEEEYSVEAACEVAVLANLGVFWSDPGIRDTRPGFEIVHRICQVEPHHLPLWKRLRGYLKPVVGSAKA